jgi:hypothetical protein
LRSVNNFSISTNCRTAYALGLNTEPQRDDHPDFIKIEERRRLFWGIYVLDAVFSLMMGRPPMISDLDIDVRLLMDISDEKIMQAEILPDDIDEERDDYIHEHLKTFAQELRKIHEDLYCVNSTKGRTQSDLIFTIQTLEDELGNWRASIPTEYRPFLSAEDPASFGTAPPLKTLFSVGYFYALCLIRRPALVEVTRSVSSIFPKEIQSPTSGVGGEGAKNIANASEDCVTTARDMLNLFISTPLRSSPCFP